MHLRQTHSLSRQAFHHSPAGFDTFTSIETVTIRQGECLPKTWAWLEARCPGCGSSIRIIVDSKLNVEFSRRFNAELCERKKAFEKLNGPITWVTTYALLKAGKL
jgi:hypothetical protein